MTTQPELLRASYERCAQIARLHGKTYSTAALLLAPDDRRHVYAIYAFCRVADDIVDEADDRPAELTAEALATFGERFRADLAAGSSSHPLLAAVVNSASTLRIDPSCFDSFLRSMTMDLTTTAYPRWDDLVDYMDGSAAVIGEMMLPVLRPSSEAAFEPARSLGVAFQLTNFLRDVGEDLDRGRVYLPQEDLTRFGVDPRQRQVTDGWRALMAFEIERTRAIYREADKGIPLLPARSARCVATARVLYSRILERIEANDYDVFTRRARVPAAEKLWVAARSLLSPRAAGSGSPG